MPRQELEVFLNVLFDACARQVQGDSSAEMDEDTQGAIRFARKALSGMNPYEVSTVILDAIHANNPVTIEKNESAASKEVSDAANLIFVQTVNLFIYTVSQKVTDIPVSVFQDLFMLSGNNPNPQFFLNLCKLAETIPTVAMDGLPLSPSFARTVNPATQEPVSLNASIGFSMWLRQASKQARLSNSPKDQIHAAKDFMDSLLTAAKRASKRHPETLDFTNELILRGIFIHRNANLRMHDRMSNEFSYAMFKHLSQGLGLSFDIYRGAPMNTTFFHDILHHMLAARCDGDMMRALLGHTLPQIKKDIQENPDKSYMMEMIAEAFAHAGPDAASFCCDVTGFSSIEEYVASLEFTKDETAMRYCCGARFLDVDNETAVGARSDSLQALIHAGAHISNLSMLEVGGRYMPWDTFALMAESAHHYRFSDQEIVPPYNPNELELEPFDDKEIRSIILACLHDSSKMWELLNGEHRISSLFAEALEAKTPEDRALALELGVSDLFGLDILSGMRNENILMEIQQSLNLLMDKFPEMDFSTTFKALSRTSVLDAGKEESPLPYNLYQRLRSVVGQGTDAARGIVLSMVDHYLSSSCGNNNEERIGERIWRADALSPMYQNFDMCDDDGGKKFAFDLAARGICPVDIPKVSLRNQLVRMWALSHVEKTIDMLDTNGLYVENALRELTQMAQIGTLSQGTARSIGKQLVKNLTEAISFASDLDLPHPDASQTAYDHVRALCSCLPAYEPEVETSKPLIGPTNFSV